MKLLAIDTSTEACSVALSANGEISERYEIAPRRHTELVLPWADELLADAGVAKAQLDAIAVARGPGAFTGVRLAVAIVQGMALALDLPVIPVSTLAALALRAPESDNGTCILAAIDARMGEVYLGAFERDEAMLVRPLGEEWMAAPASPNMPERGSWIGVGSGFAAADGALKHALDESLEHCDDAALPHAADVARLAALAWARGEATAPDLLEPAYLRNKVALTLAEQQKARG
ncbi:tRNA (adenosine(37)-N6)-threonylcarbamoyltransferase complex dimerization subunit type 1 TsaB [Arenimonas sp.]|uniref:tRNA (adenosine(37)-N6)-threonylcarbamoyltransferase complex dimerization subunit type 1 TsaB n=1 Tax=Arenimonas sp. TaxID=1872635 RepID=UPI0039E565F4